MPQGKPLVLIKPMDALVVVSPALPAKHYENTLTAVVNPG